MEGKIIKIIAASIAILMLIAIPSAMTQPQHPDGAFKVDLIADGGNDGMHYDAGDVFVWIMNGSIHVQIIANNDWRLLESHIHIDKSGIIDDGLDDIPTNKKGLPKVGRFEYKESTATSVIEFGYAESLGEIEEGQQFLIAVHAVVIQNATNITESAWGQGIEFIEGANWAMYFMFQNVEELIAELAMDVFYARQPHYFPLWGTADGGVSPYNYSWDLDMDGIYDDANGDSIIVDGTEFWSPDSYNTIGFKVEDSIGQVAYDTAAVYLQDLT